MPLLQEVLNTNNDAVPLSEKLDDETVERIAMALEEQLQPVIKEAIRDAVKDAARRLARDMRKRVEADIPLLIREALNDIRFRG